MKTEDYIRETKNKILNLEDKLRIEKATLRELKRKLKQEAEN
jgi:hypothetical protein